MAIYAREGVSVCRDVRSYGALARFVCDPIEETTAGGGVFGRITCERVCVGGRVELGMRTDKRWCGDLVWAWRFGKRGRDFGDGDIDIDLGF